jgi:hypothetical protein
VQLPYLYQRWCGLKLIEGLRRLDFLPRKDPLPALLLSGEVEFRKGSRRIHLYCDPRLVQGKEPIGGMRVQHGEASPDFVLTTSGPGGPRVFVLDPTLSTDPDVRRKKAKYLQLIHLMGSHTVAGVRMLRGPTRSWAASPLSGAVCLVEDWSGAHGTIPMNPCAFEAAPLQAWLEDLALGET